MIAVYACPVCGWAGSSVPTPTFVLRTPQPWLGFVAAHRRHGCPRCHAWLASSPVPAVELGRTPG